MQIFGDFEGFPPKIVPCLGWFHIMTPCSTLFVSARSKSATPLPFSLLYITCKVGPRADRYKWRVGNPYKWPYKWVYKTGVITPISEVRTP